jgi:chitodextrinase
MKLSSTQVRIIILTILLTLTGFFAIAQTPPSDINGEELKTWLKTNYYDGKHQTLGYSTARKYLYNYIDNENGVITCVYSGYTVNSSYGGTTTYPAPINCEHTIPQSYFNEADPMVSDIHHLYPTYENWNSTRSNYPFAEIDDNSTAKWMYLNQSQTSIPTSNIDLYSEYASSTFEPREDHKGNVARSIFYFYTMYPTQAGEISQIGDVNVFYQWHLDDPVDANEIERNGQIETYQGDRNPFIDYPELVSRAWNFTPVNSPPSTPALQFSSTSSSINLSWNNISNENGYKIYKSTNGSSYSLLTDLTTNTTSYTDNSVSENITYYYYILAYNDYGNSENSNIISGELSSGNIGIGISVSNAITESIGTSVTVDGIITESFNGIYALVMKDINGTETIIVKLEISQRDEWNPENNPSAIGKTIEVVGIIDTYSSLPSIESVSSITEIGGTTEDTESPTSPTNLASASITETSFTLNWTASTDNIAVTTYNIYQDGSLLATTGSTSYNVTGLTASTTYSYYVKAEDAAGNVSGASSTLSVTTSDTDDTEAPTAPNGLSSSNITETSANLSWIASTDNVAVTGYDIYKNGTLLSSTTNTSFSVTGLSAATGYSFYIKAKDGAGNESTASNTLNVTTSDIVTSYCTSQGNNSTYEWIASVTIGTYTNTSGAASYTDYTSEVISLEAGSSVNLTLTPGFSSSTYNEYWKIWIDYNADGDFDDNNELVFDAGSLSNSSVSGNISILSTANGTTRMRVSMKYNGSQTACESFSYGEVEDYTVTFADAVLDTEAPSIPTSLSASSITSSAANLSWNASTDNVGVTEYEVYQNGSLIGNSAITSYSITGLNASTQYSYAVKAKDAAGNISALSNSFSLTTSSVQIAYCTTKGNNVNYEWIDLVSIGSINNSTTANGGYADFTNLSTTVSPGASATINVSCGFNSSSYTEYWHVWVDWNQDGTFDSNEEMATGSSSSAGTLTYTFTVPTSALSGSTRMRVTMKYNSAATSCETFSYGEVEDYTIIVSSSKSAIIENTEKVSSIDAKLYPNPASSYTTLAIESKEITNVSYRIIDLQGRIMISKNNIHVNGNHEEQIDISKLNSGLYYILISNKDSNKTHKLFVE